MILEHKLLDRNLFLRIIFGLLYGVIVFSCTTPFVSDWLAAIGIAISSKDLYFGLMVFFGAVAAWECARILSLEKKSWEFLGLFVLVAVVFYRYGASYYSRTITYHFSLPEIFAIVLFIISIYTLMRHREELSTASGKLIFSLVYAALPFAFALGIPMFGADDRIGLEAFLLFVLIWSSDSFAYFTGRLFGKHQMAPVISPKKTWEGYIGGVVCTIILGGIIEYYVADIRGNWMVMGGLVAIFAPLGDLVESFLKRSYGVKDSGKILPGHGGILDRLDSFMLCAPIIYLYLHVIKFL